MQYFEKNSEAFLALHASLVDQKKLQELRTLADGFSCSVGKFFTDLLQACLDNPIPNRRTRVCLDKEKNFFAHCKESEHEVGHNLVVQAARSIVEEIQSCIDVNSSSLNQLEKASLQRCTKFYDLYVVNDLTYALVKKELHKVAA